MKNPIRFLFFILYLCFLPALQAQIPGLEMKKGEKSVEIPFELRNNFIIVNILFEKKIPLKFIFDTGAEHTILTKREITDLLKIHYEREVKIMGADMRSEIKAFIARKIHMDLSDVSLIKDILVLEDDYFKFDEYSGIDVHGILGAETFRGYVVKINYVRQVLTLYEPEFFKPPPPDKYDELPIEINKNKPYIYTTAKLGGNSSVRLKLLLDTGASLTTLLHIGSAPGLEMPPKVIKGNIGNGLGGPLEGYLGRIDALQFTPRLGFRNVVGSFQELDSPGDTIYLSGRNGIIGNEILSRFNVIIHFGKEKIWLQPNQYYNDAFNYDKSGLSIIANGKDLNQFVVIGVRENSAGRDAGVFIGDHIERVGWVSRQFISLGFIQKKLQGKAGKTVRLTLLRQGKKVKVRIKLKELI